MRKSLCFMRPLLSHLAWLKNLLCYMIHYGTYRGAVVGLRGAVVGVRGAAVGVRGAAVGNIGIPTYVISRGAVVRQPFFYIANLMQIICKVVLRAMLIVGDVPGLWYVKFRPLIMEIMEYY